MERIYAAPGARWTMRGGSCVGHAAAAERRSSEHFMTVPYDRAAGARPLIPGHESHLSRQLGATVHSPPFDSRAVLRLRVAVR